MIKKEMHVTIQGRVQGVGFRAQAKRFAQRLQLTGFVRNLPDGSVEIVAQGEKGDLDKLVEELKKAFGRYIQECKVSFRNPKEEFGQFFIGH